MKQPILLLILVLLASSYLLIQMSAGSSLRPSTQPAPKIHIAPTSKGKEFFDKHPVKVKAAPNSNLEDQPTVTQNNNIQANDANENLNEAGAQQQQPMHRTQKHSRYDIEEH
jgi:hypothetical protein